MIHVIRHIEMARLPIPDINAVYFIEPTLANIRHIAHDFEKDLYGKYYFHFSSYVSRELLEELAQAAIQFGQTANVSKVNYSIHLSFLNWKERSIHIIRFV